MATNCPQKRSTSGTVRTHGFRKGVNAAKRRKKHAANNNKP